MHWQHDGHTRRTPAGNVAAQFDRAQVSNAAHDADRHTTGPDP